MPIAISNGPTRRRMVLSFSNALPSIRHRMLSGRGRFVNTVAYGKNKIMSKRRTANRTGSLAAGDWVRAAAGAIEEGGVGTVAVEPLARKLGVTKGSFYWHFGNRVALLTATPERWEEECIAAGILLGPRSAEPPAQPG